MPRLHLLRTNPREEEDEAEEERRAGDEAEAESAVGNHTKHHRTRRGGAQDTHRERDRAKAHSILLPATAGGRVSSLLLMATRCDVPARRCASTAACDVSCRPRARTTEMNILSRHRLHHHSPTPSCEACVAKAALSLQAIRFLSPESAAEREAVVTKPAVSVTPPAPTRQVTRPHTSSLPTSSSWPYLPTLTPAAAAAPFDLLCKLVSVGDRGCGQTSLLKRFETDRFVFALEQTDDIQFRVNTVEVGGKKLKMHMWSEDKERARRDERTRPCQVPRDEQTLTTDAVCVCLLFDRDIPNLPFFRSSTPAYFRGAHVVLIVFDVTKESSFLRVGEWVAAVRSEFPTRSASLMPHVLLVATKIDLVSSRVVSSERIAQLAYELALPFVETSSKNNHNVHDTFRAIAERFVDEERSRYAHNATATMSDATVAPNDIPRTALPRRHTAPRCAIM